MTFPSDLRRPRRPLARLLTALAASAALLVACGGGTSQVQSFHPDRLIVFGDETSVIVDDGNADGFKYTINDRTAVPSSTVARCQSLPTFAQATATTYGFVFKECNPGGAAPRAFFQAEPGARVDDPASGLAQQLSTVSGGLGPSDMVLVMIGANDVIALWQQVNSGRMSSADAVAEAQRLGGVAAGQINAMLAAGARALVLTIPDMGLSPYALAQNAVSPGAASLLSSLSFEFNAFLRTRIDSVTFDGRNYGLVLSDDIVSAMARNPGSYLTAPSVATLAACTTASVLDCLTTTLVDGATSTSHLWADDRHLGPAAHARIATAVNARALNNPF